MDEPRDPHINRLLVAVRAGDRAALDELYSLIYRELRQLAHRERRRWDDTGTLNTTALVHEAYLKFIKQANPSANSPAHFFALAATAIRHIVSNYARDRRAAKRGGGIRPEPLNELRVNSRGHLRVSDEQVDLLVAIDRALDALERVSPRQRGVVECRFFGGMSIEETATALGISPRTVKRDWMLAQAWLQREMSS